MCEQFMEILSSVEFWKIAAPAFTAIVAWVLNERSKRNWEKWQIKKDACLRALNVANAVMSNYRYEGVDPENITSQYESIENVRACVNELACTCDGPEVLDALKKIMFPPGKSKMPIGAIVELRVAVRSELGFRGGTIENDPNSAFVGKINCEKKAT